jgi:hypothetical protein
MRGGRFLGGEVLKLVAVHEERHETRMPSIRIRRNVERVFSVRDVSSAIPSCLGATPPLEDTARATV